MKKKILKAIEQGQKITGQLCQDLNIAMSSWAHFEAMHRSHLQDAISELGLIDWGLKGALIRDTLMALCRILDDPKNTGNFSLADLSKLLSDKDLRDFLVSPTRVRQIAPTMSQEFDECKEIQENGDKISLIRDRVPKQWNSSKCLKNSPVCELRGKIWQVRKKILAHPGDASTVDLLKNNEVQDGICLIEELVDAAYHIFVGHELPGKKLEKLRHEADKFWDCAQAGFIEALKQYREQELSTYHVE